MSSKSSQGVKKIKLPAIATPRTLEAIQAEYQNVALQAGQSEYQAFVHSEDAKSLLNRMQLLNREASERNKLDQAKAKPTDGPDDAT